ncbi:MAG: efflux RND transporter permease subunit [Acidovorax sp.]|uniref:efflux RND transporter permease subunit n=1 Tax=Acidovorax sp. TaxID=1872122 RepID=UPI002614FC7E|nr:efflux RND transporter permease subunit [Acidovorax sp.]MDH4464601.1 efflux RND transporter permease subunit [Acidovorax sp.]
MSLSTPFIHRPIGTMLLTLGLALAGAVSYFLLPVAPLPQVDYPTISVSASLPGASPDTMAATVATPLERSLGAISGVTEITSRSILGSTTITLQFDLDRNVDSAARDVQAAINAARTLLPTGMPSNPTYRKFNPADSPIMILALTSDLLTRGQMYDAASTVLAQKLSQVEGVGQATVSGGALPAVRVELDPVRLAANGISLEQVRSAIVSTNANRPLGAVEREDHYWQVATNDQARVAADYAPLVLRWKNGQAVRLQDVAEVVDSVQDVRNFGVANGKPAILLQVYKQPGANIFEAVERVRSLLPALQASIPAAIDIEVVSDRTPTLRASVKEVERALLIAVALVVLVVFLFLRNGRATLIPSVAVPVSLAGTFGVMYLAGYTLDNLSLMALTVATGFVVDDAIVVLENTARHIEAGMDRVQAALLGAREVGFTVLSISLSLVAVFIPLLFMDGQVGRLFREFAVTLSVAVMISLVISLTTTPMMCALLLRAHDPARDKPPGRIARWADRGYQAVLRGYARSLDWALASQWIVVAILLAVVGMNVYLFAKIPKGYFPEQDNGQLNAGLRADQSISSEALARKLRQAVDIIRKDPAVDTVVGFSGGSRAGGGFMFVNLKSLKERPDKADSTQAVIARLRPQLNQITGLRVFLNPVQDLRMGGRSSNSTYQYTLKSDNLADLKLWATRLTDRLKSESLLQDVDTDQAENGVETYVEVDRASASRLGVSSQAIDSALYNAFGQRSVATIYSELNQYAVIMEWAPEYTRGPPALKDVYVAANPTGSVGSAANPAQRGASTGNVLSTAPSTMVPLSDIARVVERASPTSISHQDGELATTISFNIDAGTSLEQARAVIEQAEADIAMPINVRGSFQGTALSAQESQSQQTFLIIAAIVVIYIVLGVLYESLIHPVTVLTTLPSAGVGAVLSLMLFDMQFTIIALIGVFLLIGIVKKNAIMIIDFALEAERARGLTALEAVREACMLRFRPILMTTLAAALGALPLAIGFGQGSELRQPLGIAIIGGLVASQLLTLLTTPVVYVLLDRLRTRTPDERRLSRAAGHDETGAAA